MLFETIQLSPTAMGYINWNDGNAIASVNLMGRVRWADCP